MIAKNFMTYPEALRFQHELFFNGYRNSPRIMRLMECIFDQRPSVPDWWTAAKARARNLAKRIKKSMADFFKEIKVIQMKLTFESTKHIEVDLSKTPPTWTAQEFKLEVLIARRSKFKKLGNHATADLIQLEINRIKAIQKNQRNDE